MGDHDQAHAVFLLQLHQEVEDLLLDRHVQCGRRLICDEQLRITGKRDGDHHALALSARHLVREVPEALGRVGNADRLEQLDRAFAPRCPVEAHMYPQHFLDLETHGEAWIEAGDRLLKDHRNVLADDLATVGSGHFQQIPPFEGELVRRHPGGPGRSPMAGKHGHGFTGARFSDDCQDLALMHLERHAVYRPEGPGRRLEFDDEIFDFEKRHVRTSSASDRERRAGHRPSD